MRAQPTSVTITSGDCRATIATRGAGPSSLTLGGQDLLEGYEVTDSGLQASFAMRNDADAPMPAACGIHLYPSARGAATDDCTLMIPDHRLLPLDGRGLLAGPEQDDVDVLPDRDNPLAGTLLDHCLHLVPTEQDPQFVLRGPDGAGVALTTSLELSWVQIFTPDASAGMPYPGRAGGRAVAVEPMTAPPEALNSGTDLSVLVPGESLRCSWRVDVIEGVTEQENG